MKSNPSRISLCDTEFYWWLRQRFLPSYVKVPIWGPVDNRSSDLELKESVTMTEGVTVNKSTTFEGSMNVASSLSMSAGFEIPFAAEGSVEVTLSFN